MQLYKMNTSHIRLCYKGLQPVLALSVGGRVLQSFLCIMTLEWLYHVLVQGIMHPTVGSDLFGPRDSYVCGVNSLSESVYLYAYICPLLLLGVF